MLYTMHLYILYMHLYIMTLNLCYLFSCNFFSVELNIYDVRINELKLFPCLTGMCVNNGETLMYGMLSLWQTLIKCLHTHIKYWGVVEPWSRLGQSAEGEPFRRGASARDLEVSTRVRDRLLPLYAPPAAFEGRRQVSLPGRGGASRRALGQQRSTWHLPARRQNRRDPERGRV